MIDPKFIQTLKERFAGLDSKLKGMSEIFDQKIAEMMTIKAQALEAMSKAMADQEAEILRKFSVLENELKAKEAKPQDVEYDF